MWNVLKKAGQDWLRHRSPRLGAALAYYTVFSLGPLLLIVTAVAGFFLGPDAVRGTLSAEYYALLGESGGQAVDAMLQGAADTSSGSLAAISGTVLLLVAALGIVVQLKDALNTIWEVDDEASGGVQWYLRTYLISMAGVLGLGFLLAASLVLSTGLAAFTGTLGMGPAAGLLWQAADVGISTAVLAILFAMLFKYFPDTHVEWRHVWFAGLLTALLFQAGKLAIAWYIGTQGLESTYGAAASVVVLLIWVYYAAQIVLFGAEVAHVSATTELSAKF